MASGSTYIVPHPYPSPQSIANLRPLKPGCKPTGNKLLGKQHKNRMALINAVDTKTAVEMIQRQVAIALDPDSKPADASRACDLVLGFWAGTDATKFDLTVTTNGTTNTIVVNNLPPLDLAELEAARQTMARLLQRAAEAAPLAQPGADDGADPEVIVEPVPTTYPANYVDGDTPIN